MKKNMNKKALVTAMFLAFSATSWGADNSIYIDQTGDNAVIAITQDGAGNIVRGLQANGGNDNSVPASIVGDSVRATINQIGSNNKMDLSIKGVVTSGRSVDFTYRTENGTTKLSGSNNTAIVNIGAQSSSSNATNTLVSIMQLDGGNRTELNMQGGGNNATVVQSGGNSKFISTVNANNTVQTINTDGNDNQVTTNLTGNNGHVLLASTGTGGRFDFTQIGSGGSTGHLIDVTAYGNDNQVTIRQEGSLNANVVNLKIGSSSVSSSTNTYNIIQKN